MLTVAWCKMQVLKLQVSSWSASQSVCTKADNFRDGILSRCKWQWASIYWESTRLLPGFCQVSSCCLTNQYFGLLSIAVTRGQYLPVSILILLNPPPHQYVSVMGEEDTGDMKGWPIVVAIAGIIHPLDFKVRFEWYLIKIFFITRWPLLSGDLSSYFPER